MSVFSALEASCFQEAWARLLRGEKPWCGRAEAVWGIVAPGKLPVDGGLVSALSDTMRGERHTQLSPVDPQDCEKNTLF